MHRVKSIMSTSDCSWVSAAERVTCPEPPVRLATGALPGPELVSAEQPVISMVRPATKTTADVMTGRRFLTGPGRAAGTPWSPGRGSHPGCGRPRCCAVIKDLLMAPAEAGTCASTIRLPVTPQSQRTPILACPGRHPPSCGAGREDVAGLAGAGLEMLL